MKIICPTCSDEDELSRVSVGATFVTLMAWQPYYDEQGDYHSHDPNQHTTSYHCTRGHDWSRDTKPRCPAGDFA